MAWETTGFSVTLGKNCLLLVSNLTIGASCRAERLLPKEKNRIGSLMLKIRIGKAGGTRKRAIYSSLVEFQASSFEG